MTTQNLPATLTDRLNALRQRATQTSEIKHWQPTAGACITGIIKGSGSFHHPLYGEQKTMLLQDEKGDITSVILTRYLSQGLKLQNAAIGDLCAVTFHGKERSKTGHTFNRYSLLVEKTAIDCTD